MRRFLYSDPGFESAFSAFLEERRDTPEDVDAIVRDVLAAVREEGLAALLRFARDFDRVDLDETTIRVSAEEIEAGAKACPAEVRDAIAFAAGRIRAYHERQRPADLQFTDEAGSSWVGAGPRLRRWASMSPAAGPPIHPPSS